MEVINDTNCSWVNDLSLRNNIRIFSPDLKCEWLVKGAGYTSLSAARKLGQLFSNQKILIVDAQLVDTTFNDGFTSNKELENYKKKQDPKLKKDYTQQFELD